MSKKRPAPLRENLLGSNSSKAAHRSWVPEVVKVVPILAAKLELV